MALTPEQCREQFDKQDEVDKIREKECAVIIFRAFGMLDGPQKQRMIVALANQWPKHTINALEASSIVLA